MSNEQTKIIAKNTIFLYTRSILVLIITIYTSRVVLKELGIDNYGIYNVVGGFVSMFSLLSASLVNASQRFMSYELGCSSSNISRLFSNIFTIHLLLAVILYIIFESLGLWFLNNYLNIPSDRLSAANWVFQFSVLSFCLSILTIPFSAAIISYEKMNIFAYIGLFEVLAKLGVAFLIGVIDYDALISYSVLNTSIVFILFVCYFFIIKYYFSSCKVKILFDRNIFIRIFNFSGWNFIGSTAGILSTQGINMLTNIFFGVAINAARGVSEQVNNALNSFVTNFMTAMNPQITKAYARDDYAYMNNLMIRGAKYAALLFWTLSATFYIEADFILKLWLVEVPPYASFFLKLTIIYTIFQSLSYSLYTGVLATGNIKLYQIIMALITLLAFIMSYSFFRLGYGPEYGYYSMIISVVLCVFGRLLLLKKILPFFNSKEYIRKTLIPVLVIVLISIFIEYSINKLIGSGIYSVIVNSLVSIILIPVLSYILALDNKEQAFINSKINSILNGFRL